MIIVKLINPIETCSSNTKYIVSILTGTTQIEHNVKFSFTLNRLISFDSF